MPPPLAPSPQPTLTSLACIRPLSALCLGGNPLALSPRYAAEARARLGGRLLYLDGQVGR